MPCLLGTICKLADRPCPLDILRGPSTAFQWVVTSSTAPPLAPIDMIETERLWGFPEVGALD
jgi:hypothetical protein